MSCVMPSPRPLPNKHSRACYALPLAVVIVTTLFSPCTGISSTTHAGSFDGANTVEQDNAGKYPYTIYFFSSMFNQADVDNLTNH
jgi:hypothetical protein